MEKAFAIAILPEHCCFPVCVVRVKKLAVDGIIGGEG